MMASPTGRLNEDQRMTGLAAADSVDVQILVDNVTWPWASGCASDRKLRRLATG
jgi:hypothetical protein